MKADVMAGVNAALANQAMSDLKADLASIKVCTVHAQAFSRLLVSNLTCSEFFFANNSVVSHVIQTLMSTTMTPATPCQVGTSTAPGTPATPAAPPVTLPHTRLFRKLSGHEPSVPENAVQQLSFGDQSKPANGAAQQHQDTPQAANTPPSDPQQDPPRAANFQ
jgi:hypothetical protein